MNELKLFESQYIRSAWNPDEDQWYYSVIDVVAALTDSANPTDYLKKMPTRPILKSGIQSARLLNH